MTRRAGSAELPAIVRMLLMSGKRMPLKRGSFINEEDHRNAWPVQGI
jgi:hypothetical protein